MQDTGKYRKNPKDQFYTRETVARFCVDKLLQLCPDTRQRVWVEPSAGKGVFLRMVPPGITSIGLDIDPGTSTIQQQNFLEWTSAYTDVVLFGNPPFGKQSSLAKSFIQHGVTFAEYIAFILPQSFEKPSMNRVFPLHFHCIASFRLEKHAFEVNGESYDVPCVFQIWKKQAVPRVVLPPVKEFGFRYVKENGHLVIRRVGVYAGRCFEPGTSTFSKQSHYFIEFEDRFVLHQNTIQHQLNTHTFPSNTVGPRSLSKSEINVVLNKILTSLDETPGDST